MKKSCLLLTVLFAVAVSAQSHAVSVHSLKSKIFIAEVPDSQSFSIVERGARWNTIKFDNPSVPIWLSENYLKRDGSDVTVTANFLNMRLKPAKSSPVLGVAARGYKATPRKTQNGFIQLMAPIELLVVVPNGGQSLRATDGKSANTSEEESINSGRGRSNPDDSKWKMNRVQETENSPNLRSVSSSNQPDEELIVEQIDESPVLTESPATESSINELKLGDKVVEQTHRLSPGDTISLQVFGEPDLSLAMVRVPQSGSVSFPLIGAVMTAGKTTVEVEEIVRERLSEGYIRNPRLSISIDSYRPIFIKGAVYNIGAFPYTEGLTIAKALALAGGTKSSAQKNGVKISRDGTIVREGLSVDSQHQISSGDIISVAEELGGDEGSASYVYLHGEVRSPGEYQFRRGLTVEKAIVLAGGFSLRASRKKITVSRIVEAEDVPQKLKKVPLYLPVQPGDIIDVGASWF